MERTFSRRLPIPALAALTVGLATTLALAIVAFLMLQIDATSRELAAAQKAELEFADLAEKLPGLTEDAEMAGIGRAALEDLGTFADTTGQERIIAVHGTGLEPDSWPEAVEPLAEHYVRFSRLDKDFGGVIRTLGDGSEILVAFPVASTGPLTSAFFRWGLAIAFVVIAIAALAALITGGALTRRIARLNALCERVEAGEVTARYPVQTADEIGTLAGHMNAMLDELQRRLEALRDRADGLAHDLRTPLARVQARLSRLEDMVSEERAGAEVRLAGEELHRLMEAFNALLELREIETQGVLTLAPFAVGKAAEDAIELYEAVAEEEHRVAITSTIEPCESTGNASLVVRAIANILDNALKVSPEGGTIAVTVHCEAQQAVIAVQDEGGGLAAMHKSAKPSTLGGHGIGLRIVRAVASEHGGDFTLEESAGGAKATLRLPLRAP